MVRMTRIEMGLEELGELWRMIDASPMLLAVGLCGSSRSIVQKKISFVYHGHMGRVAIWKPSKPVRVDQKQILDTAFLETKSKLSENKPCGQIFKLLRCNPKSIGRRLQACGRTNNA